MKNHTESLGRCLVREKIAKVLGGMLFLFAGEAAADPSSVRLKACDVYGSGYLEQTQEGEVGIRTVKHLVNRFRNQLIRGCDTLEVGSQVIPLSSFIETFECEVYPDFSSNIPEAFNDPGCYAPLDLDITVAGQKNLVPLTRVYENLIPGDLVISGQPGFLVELRVTQVYPEFLLLTPVAGSVCWGDSGLPLVEPVKNVAVGEISSIYGPNKFKRDGLNCVGINSGNETGVAAVRPSKE